MTDVGVICPLLYHARADAGAAILLSAECSNTCASVAVDCWHAWGPFYFVFIGRSRLSIIPPLALGHAHGHTDHNNHKDDAADSNANDPRYRH